MYDFWVIVVIAIVVAGGIIFGVYASAKRRKELAEWASKRQLDFVAAKDSRLNSRYPNFNCLNRGDSRYAYNIMTGAIAGRVFLGCDYHYATGSGKSRHHHNFSLVIVKSPVLLEPLFIRPENFLDKLAEFAGFDDIDFESAEFNKKFYVKAPNKKWAYDIISPRMMEFLIQSPVFSIQFDLLSVIVYRDRTFSTADFEAAVNLINGVFERIPEYVIRDNKLRQV
jgi:hypothetical protein